VGLLGGALQWLEDTAVAVLGHWGYLGLFALMAGESMVLPIPSEAVMPFAGVLVRDGTFSWAPAILAASAGSLAGSWLGYGIGAWGGDHVLRRHGKYVLVREHHLDAAHRWFARRGAAAILACRFVPVVRHVISIPAGTARMRAVPFTLATLAGSTAWNTLLLWVGYRYGKAAMDAAKPYLDVAAVGILLLLVAYVAWDMLRAKRAKAAEPAADEAEQA